MNKYLVIGAIGAGVALIFVAKAGLKGVTQSVQDSLNDVADAVSDSVNPIKVAQNGAAALDSWYKAQGQNNTTWGNDVKAIWSVPSNLTNEQIDKLPLGAGLSRDAYQWLTGSKGNQVSDFNEWWDGLW